MRLGAGGEDVEDQLAAIQHLHTLAARAFEVLIDDLLEAPDLPGREVVVEDDQVGGVLAASLGDLDRLSLAAIGAGIDAAALLEDAAKNRLEITPVSGEELTKIAKEVIEQPPEVVERIKKILAK